MNHPFLTADTLSLLLGIVDGTPNGLIAYQPVRDESGTIIDYQAVYHNERARHLLQYSEDEFTRGTLFDRYPEGRALADKYLPLIRQNQPFVHDSYFQKADCWVETQARQLGDGFFLLLSDITARKQIEQQLQQSNTLLQSVLNGVQSGVASYNTIRDESGKIVDFEFVSANELSCQIMQRPLDQLVGQRMLTLFPSNIATGLFDRYATVVKTGVKQQFEQEYRADGISAWFDIAAVKQGDGLVLTILDISARKQAQNDLVEQTGRLEAIFESSLNGIIAMQAIRDETGQAVDFLMEAANEATSAMTGLTPATIVGTRLLTTFPGNIEAGFLALYQRVINSGKPEQTTQYYKDQNGLEAWFDISAVRQGSERVVVTFSDVTAAHQVQQQLRDSNESLEQFAGVASHDLQEPLRKIQSFGNLLSAQFGPQLGSDGQDLIRRMQSASGRMATLIQDLLAYSRLTSQQQPPTRLDLNTLVAEVLTDLEARINETNATIEQTQLPTVVANELSMRQLVQNLLGNALKFVRPNTPPQISITARQVRGKDLPVSVSIPRATAYWAIRISDNGIGFDSQYKEQIFGAFQRLHARNSTYPGTGIGLAIVKKVVDQHHGAIDAQSTPGEGATFTVYLPV